MEKIILQCENSLEGILSAVYTAWQLRCGHERIRLEESGGEMESMELFADYRTVETNPEQAGKVADAILKKISAEAYECVCKAALSGEKGKADAIYRYLILGFSMGSRVVNHLASPAVVRVFEMSRNVGFEVHHLLGFLRFKELNNGTLFAKIEPKNDVIVCLMPHFADRLAGENFVIYDAGRKYAGLHRKNAPWLLSVLTEEEVALFEATTKQEEEAEALWRVFFETLSVKERENKALQRNNLPLRFRRYMTEF